MIPLMFSQSSSPHPLHLFTINRHLLIVHVTYCCLLSIVTLSLLIPQSSGQRAAHHLLISSNAYNPNDHLRNLKLSVPLSSTSSLFPDVNHRKHNQHVNVNHNQIIHHRISKRSPNFRTTGRALTGSPFQFEPSSRWWKEWWGEF